MNTKRMSPKHAAVWHGKQQQQVGVPSVLVDIVEAAGCLRVTRVGDGMDVGGRALNITGLAAIRMMSVRLFSHQRMSCFISCLAVDSMARP